MISNIIKIINKCVSDPSYFFNHILSFLRGTYYILFYKISRRNVQIGFPLLASGKVHIVGPGRVKIGRNCAVFDNVFRGLSITTFLPSSTVIIGDGCALGGITIRCTNSVKIGDKTMTAVSLIQDSYFVDPGNDKLDANHRDSSPQPVVLGSNVWLGADSIVLAGSIIGDDSVLSAGTCCYGTKTYKEFSLISGNPAIKSFPIEKLLNFKVTR